MENREVAWQLLEEARRIEACLPVRKAAAFELLKRQFPDLKYRRFGSFAIAARQGRLEGALACTVGQHLKEFDTLEEQARRCRAESDRMYKEFAEADTRKWLDPAVDPIPAGPYEKLRECLTFPLRRSCNYGENAEAQWSRCEHMRYDDTKSILDPSRWYCTARE